MAIPSANTQKHLFLSSAGNLSAYFTMAAPLVSKIQVKLGGMDPICSLLSAWLGFSSDLRCHFSLNLLLLWDGLDSPSTSTFCLPLLQFPDSLKHLLHRAALLVLISLQWPGAPTPGPWVQCKYPDRLITNQSMRATKCNPKKRFLEGASVSSGWLQPWKTPQCGRRCRVQVADAVPKDPSELLQLLRWNSFMFRHWLALPNISNVIYIPQKRSRTLQVKPNHKPSQSLHLRKMFIFSSCRLRGARQQIWPAAAHHTNTVSTNGRLAVKTLNTALSDLSNAFLIRKETNPGTRGRPRFGGDSRPSARERSGSHRLSCSSDFLVGQPHPCPFLDCLSTILQRKQVLNKSSHYKLFTGVHRGQEKNEAECCESAHAAHTHRPLSLLQPRMQRNALGAPLRCRARAARAAGHLSEAQACVAFSSRQGCWKRRQGAGALGNWGARSIPLCPPRPRNGLGEGLGRSPLRQGKAGQRGQCFSVGMKQWQARKEKTGSRRACVLGSAAKGRGETRPYGSDPSCFRTAETPWASTSLALPQARGRETQTLMEARPWVKPISHAGSCATPNPNAAVLTSLKPQ